MPRWWRRTTSNIALFETADARRRIHEAQRETPAGEREYALAAVAMLLGISEKIVLQRVRRGLLPPPDHRGRWRGADIDANAARRAAARKCSIGA